MMKKNILYLFLLFTVFSYAQESYYSDVDLNLTGLSLKDELATKIINTHARFLSYDQVWDASKATDVNPENSSQVLLVYGWENGSDSDGTNDRERGINNNGGSVGQWNREHVYARSLGNPNLGESGPGSDAHHLRPSDTQRNSSRNNEKFAEGSGVQSLRTNNGWYPGDEWKGDVARMMMYMYLRYGSRCLPSNIGIGDNSATPDDMIDLFLKWNAEDKVSDFEKQRNTYHENTSNLEAQGNRNPFIDNPRLATRIWGGPEAEDIWGIYSNTDTENPTVPTNVTATNITTFSVDVSWDASSDNVAVTSYDVFVDGVLNSNVTNTSTTIIGLDSNTSFVITVLAKDVANNESAQSAPINITTIEDIEAPTIPANIVISNETGTSFKASWSASTDNTAVTGYEVFVDGSFLATTSDITYTVTNLTISTTYNLQVLAKDAVNNKSNLSSGVNATTTDGSTTTANELFFSEYVEGSSNNKAVEIVNVTSADVDLSAYSIKRQKDGGEEGDEWEHPLLLSGTLIKGDVYVIINGSSNLQTLIDEADFVQPNSSATNFGAPINFNGDDPVGLFKNDILIDIIGVYNGGTANFAKDKTLRRKSGVSQPNTAFDLDNEWDVLPKDTVDDIGKHNSTLSVNSFLLDGFKIYPNPINTIITIQNSKNKTINKASIYTLLGKNIMNIKNPSKEINVAFLSKGIYILKLEVENKVHSIKIVKE
ncbi:endonuclease [Polaribacter haliotis]|uniref:Endonuclease n=1 Tax=Polaribacter haliotis TaxID=1888915 RepID=A0A7L8AGC4_9FLAO|nr:endonuclease [Polaribacter haliotis]QOD61061.1 endonuclease [Polaribacter haliotis]